MPNQPSISQFDHTADIGIDVTGSTLEELFLNAAIGLFQVIGPHPGERRDSIEENVSNPGRDLSGRDTVMNERRVYSISLSGDSAEELLHDWMSELLFIHARDHVYLISCAFHQLDEHALAAAATFIPMTSEMNAQATEVKAVTHHDFRLRETEEGFKARIIFDM